MSDSRTSILDGWRGISIALVLLGHLFPIGPKSWQMNGSVASTGMAIFFILSGFLITSLLLRNQNIKHFLIRRFLRIIPLAWLALIVSLLAFQADKQLYLPHLLFYANLDPIALTEYTSHFWSLCVEMQFYIAIALLVGIFKQKAFWLLPILAIGFTLFRFANNVEMSITTPYRIDEILAGTILALTNHHASEQVKGIIARLPVILIFGLLLASAHANGGVLNYFRPYLAMLLIAVTLFASQVKDLDKTSKSSKWVMSMLNSRILFYLASVSYALYVIHGLLTSTWLGEGELIEKYMKRPLLLGITFLLAHLSTFYYEKYWIDLGKKLTAK
jgi:peptidoglycan/LPS O-acetylase OafA/YrhL